MTRKFEKSENGLHPVFVSGTSASFELEGKTAYYAPEPFSVLLNGTAVQERTGTNVFSLYDLLPDTEYTVEAAGRTCSFRTLPERVVLDVRDFGAAGDGEQDDTGAIQAAILSCPEQGRVRIPEGRYLIRPIFLKSGIRIELAQGAVLLGETDRRKYPILPGRIPRNDGGEYYLGTWEGRAESCFAGLITGIGVSDVQIYGRGVIDGQADRSDWWVRDRVKRIAWRPRGIFLNRCSGVQLQGITCRNTASWNQHPFFCRDITYTDLFLENPKEHPNTDGIDPESCDGVSIVGCRFSVGDDCIAIKSGKDEMGRLLKTPCRNVKVRNCLMEFGHGGVTLGSEISAGLYQIEVTQCVFRGTDRGLRIKTQRGRGSLAVIDGVCFDNIEMDGVKAPLVINMFYKARNDEPDTEYRYSHRPQPVDERTPYFGSFEFRNIRAVNAEWAAGVFWGLEERPIERITMEDCSFSLRKDPSPGAAVMTLNPPEFCGDGMVFSSVGTVRLRNVTVEGCRGERYTLSNVGSFREEN